MILSYLKKIFSNIGNILVLLLIVIIPLFCYFVGSSISIPDIGYIVSDELINESEVSYITKKLKENNYIKYDDKNKMIYDIDNSIIDAGIVINDAFFEKLENNELEDIIEFYSSESSIFSDMRKIDVMSKFMTIASPYVTYDTIKKIAKGMHLEEYSIDKIKAAYYDLYDNDTSVLINIEKVDGDVIIENNKGEIYYKVTLVFLIIIIVIFFVIFDSVNYAKKMNERLKKDIIIRKIFIPLVTLKTIILCILILVTIFLKSVLF